MQLRHQPQVESIHLQECRIAGIRLPKEPRHRSVRHGSSHSGLPHLRLHLHGTLGDRQLKQLPLLPQLLALAWGVSLNRRPIVDITTRPVLHQFPELVWEDLLHRQAVVGQTTASKGQLLKRPI